MAVLPLDEFGVLQQGLLILIVDDEEIIRGLLCEVLEAEGFVTHALENADQALDFLKRESLVVGLLLTDINMPGSIDGADLVNISTRVWPLIPVVVMSGVETLRSAGIAHAAWFLRKPFDIEILVTCVRDALGGSSS